MAANADIPGLVSDKDFLGLPPAQQRNVLFRVTGDDSFNKLGDGETMQFIQGVKPRSVASPIPAPSVANTPGLGQVPQPNMPPTLGNLPSPKGMMAQQTQPSPAVGALALGGAAAMGGEAAAPLVGGAARLVQRHPIATMAALEAAKSAPGAVGRVAAKIPSWLPLLAGLGKGGGAVAAEEGAAATEAEAATGTRVAAGKLPRETGAPYTGRSVPEMENVQSSNIRKAGYDSAKQRMWVEFKNGRVYTHDGVPPEIYKNFQDAESAGSFHAQNIKGRYDTTYRGSVLGRK